MLTNVNFFKKHIEIIRKFAVLTNYFLTKKRRKMKKLSYLLMAFAMFAFVACNNKPAETTEETPQEEVVNEDVVEEPVIDEAIIDDVVEEQE
jgi:uncharacterized lipoprotein YajG